MRGLARREDLRLAIDLGVRSDQADARDRIARPANLLVVRDAVRRSRGHAGVHVLDQGPVQEWWSAALRADDVRVLEWAASDPAPRADLVVRVDAPVDVLVARLARRQARQSRLEGVTGRAREDELRRGARSWMPCARSGPTPPEPAGPRSSGSRDPERARSMPSRRRSVG